MNQRTSAEKGASDQGIDEFSGSLEYQTLSIHILCYQIALKHRAILTSPNMIVKC